MKVSTPSDRWKHRGSEYEIVTCAVSSCADLCQSYFGGCLCRSVFPVRTRRSRSSGNHVSAALLRFELLSGRHAVILVASGTNALSECVRRENRIPKLWGRTLVYAGSAMLLERQKASRTGRMPVTAASLCARQRIVS